MSRRETKSHGPLVLSGWQGVTVEAPENWNIGAISGDAKAGYVRYDDEEMPRLEIKWTAESGFVDLDKVVGKYLADIQKGRPKHAPEIKVDRDIKLVSKRKRKKPGLRCFHWQAEGAGYGAAWVCKDCGRTMIAQVVATQDEAPEAARELAADVLLSIEDHPPDDWTLWSAYGFSCRVPSDFPLSGQRLMAGLIELEFEKDTETIKVARWGMANVALGKKTLQEWVGTEMGKALRRHHPDAEQVEIKGHEGLNIEGGWLPALHRLACFYRHCIGRMHADRLVARAWHCEPTNKLFYVETFVDRANTGLADEIVERIECHPGAGDE